jgi:hypothetical protein
MVVSLSLLQATVVLRRRISRDRRVQDLRRHQVIFSFIYPPLLQFVTSQKLVGE